MPYHYSEDQIREYWGWCGDIQELDLMTFPDTGRFRGIAFITFATQEGYEAALACDGEQLEGQVLKVRGGGGGWQWVKSWGRRRQEMLRWRCEVTQMGARWFSWLL